MVTLQWGMKATDWFKRAFASFFNLKKHPNLGAYRIPTVVSLFMAVSFIRPDFSL